MLSIDNKVKGKQLRTKCKKAKYYCKKVLYNYKTLMKYPKASELGHFSSYKMSTKIVKILQFLNSNFLLFVITNTMKYKTIVIIFIDKKE